MDIHGLSDDLAALERELAGRSREGPSTSFRPRLTATLEQELKRPRNGVAARSFWQFAASAAAAMLLAINLSMSAANDTDWGLSGGIDPERVSEAARQIHELTPEISEREALRQAVVLQSSSRMLPLPNLKPSMDAAVWDKRRELSETF